MSKRPTLGILLMAMGFWLLDLFVIEPFGGNGGYFFSVHWKMFSPTLIALFLYFRAMRQRSWAPLQFHVTWMVIVGLIVYLGLESWLDYETTPDAPRGLIWDFYQLKSLVVGLFIYWISYFLVRRQ